jgi:hypothetical protein
MERIRRFETAIIGVGLDRVDEILQPRRPTKLERLTQELDEDEAGPPQQRLATVLEQLREKQETMELRQRSFHLLEHLPELPDHTSLDGDDVYGVLSDANDYLPGEACVDFEAKDFLAGLGVPDIEIEEAFHWDGWTVGMLRQAIASMAKAVKSNPEIILARALKERRESQENGRAEVKKLAGQVKQIRREIELKAEQMKRERILPDDNTLQRIARYESHLSRQMYQALHELQRLQAVRAGERVPAPAALDVTVNSESGDRQVG